MPDWRENILKQFRRGSARLTLVSDPDGLLAEERMVKAVQERGFEIIPFDDPVAFRFAYESKYRSAWDDGRPTELVVVLRSQQELGKLPYDLLKAGRQLAFALHKLFPKLSYPVIEALDRSKLDSLYDAYQQYDGSTLGDRATKEFVLTHCFGIVPKLVKTPVDLLKLLLSRHYKGVAVPEPLDDLLLEALKAERAFADWPLDAIVRHRDAFLKFLQEKWPTYIQSLKDGGKSCIVPFGHEDVRVYIDNLFLEGMLTPIRLEDVSKLPQWVLTGIAHDPQQDATERLLRLMGRFAQELPPVDASHRDWQRVATTWAEMVVLRWELADGLSAPQRQQWNDLHQQVEQQFGKWIVENFASLPNLPFHPQPVMLHHIARHLAAQRSKGEFEKVALVVMDGLALDQWLLVRRVMESQHPDWRFDEGNVFAWVPTLTSVSRQSIFAAEPPLYFPDSFERTDKERNLWCRFWEDQTGRGTADVAKQVESEQSEELDAALANGKLRALGIVVNKVDNILHGMQLGTAGMHSQVRLWAADGKLSSLLERLHQEGFTVYITADHGNVAATGIGSPKEGILVEFKGKRARVYDKPSFRADVKKSYPKSIEWQEAGLPADRYVLLSPDLQAFAGEGEQVVSHGGISLEEVVVPFVRIRREA